MKISLIFFNARLYLFYNFFQYDHLLTLGAATIQQFLSGALKQIMTDSLVCKFTWHGGENSIQFGDTRVANMLFRKYNYDLSSFLASPIFRDD